MFSLTPRAFLLTMAAAMALAGCRSHSGVVSVERAPETSQASTLDDPTSFRPHHYLFAHRVLPQVFYGSTELLLLHLRGEGVEELKRLWQEVASRLDPVERLPAAGFTLEITRHEPDLRVFWITLPPAERSPEAHYVALAVRGPERTYYTLEKSISHDGQATTAFCTWTREGSHKNFGQAGPPTLEDFRKRVLQAELSGQPPVEATFTPAKR